MADWKDKVKDIVDASQETATSHERLLKDLRKIYDSVGRKEFAQQFIKLVTYPLIYGDKSMFVNTCLSFLAKFVVSTAPEDVEEPDEEEESIDEPNLDSPTGFFVAVIRFILKVVSSTNKIVRQRACQYLELLLSECRAQKRKEALDSSTWDLLLVALIERCKDKAVPVRQNAVGALAKLQQPGDSHCRAMGGLRFLMHYDPNPDIRSQCAHLILTTKPNLALFVDHCRDISEGVRRTVLFQIGERKVFKFLKVEQRLAILHSGLNDSAESVRVACERFVISSWLEEVGNDIAELIRRLDLLFTNRNTCEKLLDVLYKEKSPDDIVEIFVAKTQNWKNNNWLTPERVFCLRHFIRFLTTPPKNKNSGRKQYDAAHVEEWIEQLLPPLMSLADFVETYMTTNTETEELDLIDGLLHRDFIVSELVELLILADKSDAAGRNRIQKMLETVVSVASDTVLPILVRLHMDLHQNMERTIEWMALVISDWTMMPTPVQPPSAFMDRSISFMQQPGAREETILDDERMTINLFKSLTVLSEVLVSAKVRTLTTTLRSLYENLVLPAIQVEDSATRRLAFRCLGLSCLLDRPLASKHAHVFLEALNVDVDMVRKTAVEILFDLVVVFQNGLVADIPPRKGPDGPENEQKKTASEIVADLNNILYSDDVELHDIVADGIAKLQLYFPKLLPKMPVEEKPAL